MKNHLLKIFAFFTATSLFSYATFAQEDKNITLKKTDKNGQLSFVTFNEKANYYVSSFEKILKAEFQLQDGIEFIKLYSETDKLGFTHDKYQLYISGVKIEFATYTVHSKNEKIFAINGETYKTNNVSTTPEISAQEALQNAIKHLNAKQYLWDNPAEAAKLDNYKKPSGELVLLPIFNDESVEVSDESNLKLTYKFDIYATQPVSRGDVYVDAQTGQVLFYNARIKHATNFGYSSSLYNKKRR